MSAGKMLHTRNFKKLEGILLKTLNLTLTDPHSANLIRKQRVGHFKTAEVSLEVAWTGHAQRMTADRSMQKCCYCRVIKFCYIFVVGNTVTEDLAFANSVV